jgi:hypothetical protein
VHQAESFVKGIHGADSDSVVYGIDFRRRLPYQLDLRTGDFTFLSSSGRGPEELSMPSQLTVAGGNEMYIYDTLQDIIARFSDGRIVEKLPGFLGQGVWLRHARGYYWNGYLFTPAKEPERLNVLDFEHARPISKMNLATGEASWIGEFSPTLDDLDSYQKYPYIALDMERERIYYVFNTDYSILRYDLTTGETDIVSDIKLPAVRTRTLPFDYNQAYHYSLEYGRRMNMDMTRVSDIGIVDDYLVVVWNNANEKIFEHTEYDPENYDYFGIIYSLPDFHRAWQFQLPGRLLGFWNNRILVEENFDILDYRIGVYKVQH